MVFMQVCDDNINKGVQPLTPYSLTTLLQQNVCLIHHHLDHMWIRSLFTADTEWGCMKQKHHLKQIKFSCYHMYDILSVNMTAWDPAYTMSQVKTSRFHVFISEKFRIYTATFWEGCSEHVGPLVGAVVHFIMKPHTHEHTRYKHEQWKTSRRIWPVNLDAL